MRSKWSIRLGVLTNILQPRWSQSERVQVFVGLDGEEERFLIPRDLLAKRSPQFREQLAQAQTFTLRDVSPPVFRRFYRWCLSPNPSIEPQTTQEELESLAFLAYRYQIFELGNQAADWLEKMYTSRQWNLRREMIRQVYQECGDSTGWLRHLTREMLKTIPENRRLNEVKNWLELVQADYDFAKDYCEVLTHRWGPRDIVKGEECRFHDHTQHRLPGEAGRAELATRRLCPSSCPFRGWGCFLDVATEEVSSWDRNKVLKKSKKERKEEKRKRKLSKVPLIACGAVAEDEPVANEELVVEDEPAANEELVAEDEPAEEVPVAWEEPAAIVKEVKEDGWENLRA